MLPYLNLTQEEPTECGRNADNDALALELLGQVHLVAWRVLHELDIGQGIANLHEAPGGRVEGTA